VCFAAVNNSSPRDPVSTPAAGADCLLLFGGELGSQRDVDGSATSPAHLHGTFSEPSRNLLGSATSPGHSVGTNALWRLCLPRGEDGAGVAARGDGAGVAAQEAEADASREAAATEEAAARWHLVQASGAVPCARFCHSAALEPRGGWLVFGGDISAVSRRHLGEISAVSR